MPQEDLGLMVDLAREHYLEGRSKVELAERFGISRFRAARLLEAAQEQGIVRISIADPRRDAQQDAQLAERLGVASVTIASPGRGEAKESQAHRSALARGAAGLLGRKISEGSRIGVAWSRTLMHLPQHIEELPRADIVQLVGPLSAPGTTTSASTSLIHALGSAAGGQVWPLPTPLIVDSDEVAESLRSTAEVHAALQAQEDLDIAVVSIGAWDAGTSTFFARFEPEEQRRTLGAGVVAECSGILISADGQVAPSGVENRVIGVRPDQLRRAHVIAVAPADGYPDAVIAAARAGLVDDVVLSGVLAAQVSRRLGAPERPREQ